MKNLQKILAQQSWLARNAEPKRKLAQHLQKIKDLFSKAVVVPRRCYISYAWPTNQTQDQDYWVQPFLKLLYEHLTLAGVRVILDIVDFDVQTLDYDDAFLKDNIKYANSILLLGSSSLSDGLYDLTLLRNRVESDMKQFGSSSVHSLFIDLVPENTINVTPSIFQASFVDIDKMTYVELLENILEKTVINCIYRNEVPEVKKKSDHLWQEFYRDEKPVLNLPDTESRIQIENNLAYHKHYFNHMIEDLRYKIILAIRTPKSVLPEVSNQNLFQEYGRQFQTPCITISFVKRETLFNKIIEQFSRYEVNGTTLVLKGLSGMGKTQLAAFYFSHPCRKYELRAWFNAESKSELCNQYVELAETVGMQYPESMSIENKAMYIKAWLEKQDNLLLVYDHVRDRQSLDDLIPTKGSHHVIITSRDCTSWPPPYSIQVDTMERNEAIELIQNLTGYDKNPYFELLVDTLGKMPLVLTQAGTFMAKKSASVSSYLNFYRKNQISLLKYNDSFDYNDKHLPVWDTFNSELKNLEKSQPLAMILLKQLCWLAPEWLPKEIIEKDEFTRISDALYQYSFVYTHTSNHQIRVHKLLQDIVRLQLQANETIKSLLQMCKAIDFYIEQNNTKLENIKILEPHILTLHQHAQDFNLMEELETTTPNLYSFICQIQSNNNAKTAFF